MGIRIVTKGAIEYPLFEYSTIGAAITAAVSGDEIFIKAGTWGESINIDGKILTIYGEGDSTIIEPPNEATYGFQTNRNLYASSMKFDLNKTSGASGIRLNGAEIVSADVSSVKFHLCQNGLLISNAQTVTVNNILGTQCVSTLYCDSATSQVTINGVTTSLGTHGIYAGNGNITVKNLYLITASTADIWVNGSNAILNIDSTSQALKVRSWAGGTINVLNTLRCGSLDTTGGTVTGTGKVTMINNGTFKIGGSLHVVNIPSGITMTLGGPLTVTGYVNKLGNITYGVYAITGSVVVIVDSTLLAPGVTDYLFNPNNEGNPLDFVIIDEGINCILQSNLYVSKCVLIYGQIDYNGKSIIAPELAIKPANKMVAEWINLRVQALAGLVIGSKQMSETTIRHLAVGVFSNGYVALLSYNIVNGVFDDDSISVFTYVDIPEVESDLTNTLCVIKYLDNGSQSATVDVKINGEDVMFYSGSNIYDFCVGDIQNGLLASGDSVSFTEYYNIHYNNTSDEYINWIKGYLTENKMESLFNTNVVGVQGKFGGVPQIGSLASQPLTFALTIFDDVSSPKRSEGHINNYAGAPFARNIKQALDSMIHRHGAFVLLNPIVKRSFVVKSASGPNLEIKSGGTMATIKFDAIVSYFNKIGRS